MADNVVVDNGTGTDYGVAGDKVTYSGDADQTVQLVRVVGVTGAEGSKTVIDITGDDGLFVAAGTSSAGIDAFSNDQLVELTRPGGSGYLGTMPTVFNGTTWDRLRGSTNGLWAQGNVAHDAVDAGNPVKIGGKAETTVPAAVADGDRVDAWFDEFGALSVNVMNRPETLIMGGDSAEYANVTGTGPYAALNVGGNVAHDAADSGNPIKIGGKASDGSHAAVAHGDRVDAWFAPGGQQVVTVAGFAVGGGASAIDGTSNGNTTGLLDPDWGSGMLQTSGMVFNGTSWDRQRGNTAGTFQQGNVAHDAVDAGNPIKIGGKYVASMVAVADGDRTNILTDQYGRIRFSDGDSLSVAGASGDVVVSLESPSGIPIEATGVGASSALNVGGNVAHDAADSGNPVKIGGYAQDGTRPAVAVGDRVDAAFDELGNLGVFTTYGGLSGDISTTSRSALLGLGGTNAGPLQVANAVFTGTSWVGQRGNTDGLFAQGAIAHDAADSGNPVKIGGYASTAAPTAVTAGDRVNAWYMTDGRAVVTIAGTGGVAGTTTPADAAANAIGANVWSENALFNGTTWDRLRNLPAYDTAVAAPVRLGVAAVAQPDQRFTSVALGTVVSNTQAWDCNGADDVLIHLATTQTGTFTFEVTADGTNWSGATVRDTATNLWVSGTNLTPTANKVYRILTHGWRSVRARTVTTLNGTVAMTATLGPRSPLDQGTVTGAAPHDFGYTPWSFSADISTGTTTNIKTPTSGRRLVTTAFTLGTAGTTAGLVTVWYAASGDTTVSVGTDDILFRGNLTPTTNATPGVVMTYPNNPPTGTVDFLLKVTTGAATTLYVTARGYEIV